jgi:hypothetical protein
MAETPPSLEGMQRKHKPPKCFTEDEEQCLAKKRKATLTQTSTQSSISSTTSSAKSQNKKNVNKELVSTSPPCAQPCAPKDAADRGNDDTHSQKSIPE